MRVASTIQLGLALFFAVVALALRGPIQDGLLEGNETLYWVFFGAVLFYAASYFARGFLAGQRRFGPFTALILSESVFRTSFAVLVAVGLLSGQSAVAIGIVAAPSLSPAGRAAGLRPAAPGRSRRPPPGARTAKPRSDDEHEDFSMRKGGGFAAAVLVIMFSEQAFLNAGPLIARGLAGRRGGGVHLQRADDRAGAAAALPGGLDQHPPPPDQPPHLDRTPTASANSTARCAWSCSGSPPSPPSPSSSCIAGPQLMQIAFSDKFTYDRAGLLLVTLGMGLYLGSVTLNQACLAQGQVRRAAARWIGCAAFFIAWNFVPLVSNEFRRVEIGFALTAGVLFALLYLVYRRPHERAEDVPEAGSPEELEARLAAIDENV